MCFFSSNQRQGRTFATDITGTPEKKQVPFNYLVELAPSVPGAGELIQSVQQAIFGADFATLGQNLTGEYAQVSELILAECAGD